MLYLGLSNILNFNFECTLVWNAHASLINAASIKDIKVIGLTCQSAHRGFGSHGYRQELCLRV